MGADAPQPQALGKTELDAAPRCYHSDLGVAALAGFGWSLRLSPAGQSPGQ
jgi:hypothetical protein